MGGAGRHWGVQEAKALGLKGLKQADPKNEH